MISTRRQFIAGLSALIAAPAIVRAESLMRIVPHGNTEQIFFALGNFVDPDFVPETGPIPVGMPGFAAIMRRGLRMAQASGVLASVRQLTLSEIAAERRAGNNVIVYDNSYDSSLLGLPIRIKLPEDFRA